MVRKSEHMFGNVNITAVNATILAFLSRSPNKQYYLREIAKNIGRSVGGTHKALKNLEKMGVINKQPSGKNLYFRVNEDHAGIKFFKIFVTIKELEEFLKDIKIECKTIILFGSCSTREDTIESDIDLLVVTTNPKTTRNFFKDGSINNRPIKAIILSPKEFLNLKSRDRAFYNEIRKGIELWRDIN